MGRPSNEEIAARQAAEAKAKADELAKQIENGLGSAQDVKAEDTPNESLAADSDDDEVEKELEYKVYDHMVKVNGVFYNAGDKVPVE